VWSPRLASLVDVVVDLHGVREGRWRDTELAPERMVEPEHDEQQQAKQNRNGAGQDHVPAPAVQAGETHQPDEYDASEQQTAPQQPGYPPPPAPAQPAYGQPAYGQPAYAEPSYAAPGTYPPTAPGGWTPPPKPGLLPLRPLGFGTLLWAPFRTLRRNPAATFGSGLVVQLASVVATAAVFVPFLLYTFSRVEGLILLDYIFRYRRQSLTGSPNTRACWRAIPAGCFLASNGRLRRRAM